MKKIISIAVLTALIVLGLFFAQGAKALPKINDVFYYSYCDEPIKYRVDTIDPKFDLTKDQFLKNINQASEIWNSVEGKKLFEYDPKGELSINMIFDERQSLTTQIGQLEDTVKQDQNSLKPQITEFEKLSADFKQIVEALNKEISDWNNKGGAPPDEYEKLVKRQEELRVEADRLNTMAKALNQSTVEYNSEVHQLNQTINNFNEALQERPEEGIYKGPQNRIEIYFNTSQKGLVHTLAHELGHALGMDHVNNPKAIMYTKTNKSLIPTIEDVEALQEICRERSFFEILKIYFKQRFNTTN